MDKFDERSAGGIVYRADGKDTKWLVIKTASKRRFGRLDDGRGNDSKLVYKFPKGHLLPNEFLKSAAIREVEEEGRVKARVISKVGSRDYIMTDKLMNRKVIKKVTFFLMEYVEDSKLRHFDREMVLDRTWLSYNEAMDRLAYDSERKLLTLASKILTRER